MLRAWLMLSLHLQIPFHLLVWKHMRKKRLRGAHLDYHPGVITIIIIIIIIVVMGLVFILPVLSRHRNKPCSAWSTSCAENGWRVAKKKWSFKILPKTKGQQPKHICILPKIHQVLEREMPNAWKKVIQCVPQRKERVWLIGHSGNG